MKFTLIILNLLSVLSTAAEASRLFKYFLPGGRSKQVVPFDPKKPGNEDVTLNSDIHGEYNENEGEEHKSAFEANVPSVKKVKNQHRRNAIVPYDYQDSELDSTINETSIAKNKDSKVQASSYTEQFRNFLADNDFSSESLALDLTEHNARELLKIKIPISVVLSSEQRTELMAHQVGHVDHKTNVDTVIDGILDFDKEIENDLENVVSLKDFLRVVVKFYKVCFKDLILWDCAKAILESKVFDVKELPRLFDMNFDELFKFACENNLSEVAKELIAKRSSEGLNLFNVVLETYKNNNHKLCDELLESIRENFSDNQRLKFFLPGGRDKVYHEKIVPVNFDVDDQGTPSCTPPNSDRVKDAENSKHKEEKEECPENILKTKTAKTKKSKKLKKSKVKKAAIVPISEPEEEPLNNVPIPTTPAIKPTKTKLGENAAKIRKLLGSNGVLINLKDLSEESAQELLKIKLHMKRVLNQDARIVFLSALAIYIKPFSYRKIEKLYDEIDEKLKEVENLKQFLEIVINFYKNCSANDIVSDCTLVILGSGVMDIEELPEFFDQIFQFACVNGLNNLAKELVRRKSSKKLNLYQGVWKAFDNGNEKLGYELMSMIKEIDMDLYGDLILDLELNLDDIEEEKS